jgi:predicted esterase YcpF (UPF0227 family)
MRKVIFYFHGFGFNPSSEKVFKLKNVFPEDIIVKIEINYRLSEMDIHNQLEKQISEILQEHLYEEVEIIFMGTSMGAWWASQFHIKHLSKLIVINPVYDPKNTIKKIGFPLASTDKYQLADYSDAICFIAENDEIIDHSELLSRNKGDIFVFNNAKHRFSGDEFQSVINYIKTI